MIDNHQPPQTTTDNTRVRRYLPVTLLTPLLGAALGIDGGPIFQIIAVENLGLGPPAIGFAFGIGIVSLPLQLAAARIPLRRARRNVQIFLVIAAVQCWILASLVGAGVTGGLAAVALAVTVTAEVALSVLFATAWQPLLSTGLGSVERQRLNSTWPAVARGLMAGALIVFAASNEPLRAGFLVIVGALAVCTAVALRSIEVPLEDDREGEAVDSKGTRLSPDLRLLLLVFAAINFGALPLWLVYLNEVLWPTVNLGVIAAIQTGAAMVALLAWRPTKGEVGRRAVGAALLTAFAAITVALLRAPVESSVAQAVVVGATFAMGAGATLVRVAMLEAAHRLVTSQDSVRLFTVLDVVASTTLQTGLLVSGFLISASTKSRDWLVDPYQGFLVACAAAALATTMVVASRTA